MDPAPVSSRELYPPAPEGYYRILPGDTLSSIAVREGLDRNALAHWNRLESPYKILAGQLLRVEPPAPSSSPPAPPAAAEQPEPAAAAEQPKPASVAEKPPPAAPPRPSPGEKKVPDAKSRTAAKPPPRTPKKSVPATVAKRPPARPKAPPARPKAAPAPARVAQAPGLHWQWPIRGRVVQRFDRRDRTRQGIRIRGQAGDRIAAAEAGTVVYSGGGLKGYGNLIILKHNEKYLSAYGFNRRLLVAEGTRVKRGQRIAEIGPTAGGTYLLHFEIRRDGTAIDPLDQLPASP